VTSRGRPAPKLYATAGTSSLPHAAVPGSNHVLVGGTALIHVVPVPLNPSVSVGVIMLAVALALADGLLAGAFGSW
jgi:hypothetical protein